MASLVPEVSFGHPGYVWISFFTDWTFCLFAFAGLIGAVVTAQRTVRDRRSAQLTQPLQPATIAAPPPGVAAPKSQSVASLASSETSPALVAAPRAVGSEPGCGTGVVPAGNLPQVLYSRQSTFQAARPLLNALSTPRCKP